MFATPEAHKIVWPVRPIFPQHRTFQDWKKWSDDLERDCVQGRPMLQEGWDCRGRRGQLVYVGSELALDCLMIELHLVYN